MTEPSTLSNVSTFLQPVSALLYKEFRQEIRSRVAINGLILFIVITVSLIAFSTGGSELKPLMWFALYWIGLFFTGMTGLGRAFIAEADQGTMDLLRFLAKPSHIFSAKLIFNFLLLTGASLLLLALFMFFFDTPAISWHWFLPGLILACLAISSASTFLAAIVSLSDARGALFPVLAFPVLLPLIMVLVQFTRLCLIPDGANQIFEPLSVMTAYAGVMITAGVLLFDWIWL